MTFEEWVEAVSLLRRPDPQGAIRSTERKEYDDFGIPEVVNGQARIAVRVAHCDRGVAPPDRRNLPATVGAVAVRPDRARQTRGGVPPCYRAGSRGQFVVFPWRGARVEVGVVERLAERMRRARREQATSAARRRDAARVEREQSHAAAQHEARKARDESRAAWRVSIQSLFLQAEKAGVPLWDRTFSVAQIVVLDGRVPVGPCLTPTGWREWDRTGECPGAPCSPPAWAKAGE